MGRTSVLPFFIWRTTLAIVFDKQLSKTQTYGYNPDTDTHAITTHEDVSGLLDALAAKRNGTMRKFGKAEEWSHYCSIPPTVQIELRNRGLDINNRDHLKRICRIIDSEFPYLKATTKIHA